MCTRVPVLCVRFQLFTHIACHQPICLAFEPDNTMLDLDTDESRASTFDPRCSTGEFLLTPVRFHRSHPSIPCAVSLYVLVWSNTSRCVPQVKAEFKWQPSKQKPDIVTVWRENFEVSPALCFTEYKVIGSTLKSVIIHLPDPVDLKGKKTLGLQQKLVLLSRTRRTEDLAFLCHDDYDFPQFLKALTVPRVRCGTHVLIDADRLSVSQDLEHEWRRLERIGDHTRELSKQAPWWPSITQSTCPAPSHPAHDVAATPAVAVRRTRRSRHHRPHEDASPPAGKRVRTRSRALSTAVRAPTVVDDSSLLVQPQAGQLTRQSQTLVANGCLSRRGAIAAALDTSDAPPVHSKELNFDNWSNQE